MADKSPKLAEIAERIAAHLKKFELDPVINRPFKNRPMMTTPYHNTNAWAAGRFVGLHYVSYQHEYNLTKDEALAYLARLDAGFVGKHFSKGA